MFGKEDLGIRYFNLEDYVKKIKINNIVKDHLEYTEEEFINYIKKISKYKDEYINKYWIYLLYNEMKSNQAIENYNPHNVDKIPDRLLSNNLVMTNNRIHELHDIIMQGKNKDGMSYRDTGVKISSINQNGQEKIFYYGAHHDDLQKFMNDFIKIYDHIDDKYLNESSFLKSALLHMLFIRIHPYRDGNGRTARVLHNLKFSASLSKFYGVNLKLSPINLSKSINLNKITYVNILDNLAFNNKDDDNELINKWFDFILNMADEQIYMSSNQADRIDDEFLKEIDDAVTKYGQSNPKDNGVKQLKKYYK